MKLTSITTNSSVVGPKVTSKTYVYKQPKPFFTKRLALSFLIFSLILAPIANSLFSNPNVAKADQALFGWAKQITSTDYEYGNSIAVDSGDNVYTTGRFRGTVDFDPGAGTSNLTSAGNNDIFVSKLNASGDFVWAKSLGGTGSDIGYYVYLGSDDSVYTTGRFSGTADFDPGAGTSNLTSAGDFDIFISKLDSSGDFVWAKSLGGTGLDSGYSLATDSSHNVYITGFFSGTADFDPGAGTSNLTSAGNYDVFVSKLDSSGDFAWAKGIGSTGFESGNSIFVDSSINIYLAGDFQNTVDFDPGAGTSNLTSAGNYDVYVSKLNSSGDFIWAKGMGGTGADRLNSMGVDDDLNIHTTGWFVGTADFDPGAGTSNLISAGGDDIFVSKLNASGDFVWAKGMGGTDADYGYGTTFDSDGNVYTTGYFAGTADFDPGAGTSNLTATGWSSGFVSKLNSDGDFVFVAELDSTGVDGAPYPYSIDIDSDNNIYTTGEFYLSVDFDPGAGTQILTDDISGNGDMFISKLSQILSPSVTTQAAASVSSTGVTLNGNITNTGGVDATERGFNYGLDNTYGTTVTQNTGPYSTGAFTADVTGLTCGTQYSYRSFATNTEGTSYGSETTFTTSACPTGDARGGPAVSGGGDITAPAPVPDPVLPPAIPQTPVTPSIPETPTVPPTTTPTTPTTNPSLVPSTEAFLRNLFYGSTGEDVKRLQQFLNINEFKLDTSGAGSPSRETSFFGVKTRNALKSFQAVFSSQILSPLGLTLPTGNFGDSTRGFVNSILR